MTARCSFDPCAGRSCVWGNALLRGEDDWECAALRGGSFCLPSACRDAPLGQRQGGVFRLPPPYLWTPPTPQQVKGCTPLTILKKKSKHKKASAAPVGAIALTLFSLLHLKPLSRCATAPPGGASTPAHFAPEPETFSPPLKPSPWGRWLRPTGADGRGSSLVTLPYKRAKHPLKMVTLANFNSKNRVSH